MKKIDTRHIARAGIIAALYAAVTLVAVATPVGAFMFGPVQVRVSEALTVLPALTGAAVPGLFIGCLVTNIIGSFFGVAGGALDIVFGSLATLLAAWLSYLVRDKKWLVPLPPVVVNAVAVGLVLHLAFDYPLVATMGTVGLGQIAACYVLGMPLLLVLEKYKGKIFR